MKEIYGHHHLPSIISLIPLGTKLPRGRTVQEEVPHLLFLAVREGPFSTSLPTPKPVFGHKNTEAPSPTCVLFLTHPMATHQPFLHSAAASSGLELRRLRLTGSLAQPKEPSVLLPLCCVPTVPSGAN